MECQQAVVDAIRWLVTYFLEDLREGSGVELDKLLLIVSRARRARIRIFSHL